jgi:hypothetical protein
LDIEAMTGNIRILERHIVSRGNGLLERLAVERKAMRRGQRLVREIYNQAMAPRFCGNRIWKAIP